MVPSRLFHEAVAFDAIQFLKLRKLKVILQTDKKDKRVTMAILIPGERSRDSIVRLLYGE
jgi:hypothetical protein